MADQRIIAVTGVAGSWGARVAAQLQARPGVHVIGLDSQPPEKEFKDLDFIQADIRNSVLGDLFRAEGVDTLVHLAFEETVRPGEEAFDLNVMGTMKLLGMAAEAGVRKVVLQSSTMVYGAEPANSLYLRETQPLHGSKNYGYTRDLVEVESFLNGFRRQQPRMVLTWLRFGHVVGPQVETPMTRFLREEEAFVLLGFDPLMQVIHANDAVRALVHAVETDVPGPFNVAAPGVIPLWKLMGLAGKMAAPVFHPLAYASVSLLGPRYAPIELDYLRYPCIGDVARMTSALRFTPQYTGEETLREFATHQRKRRFMPEGIVRKREEDQLRALIERRRRGREQASPNGSGRKRKPRGHPAPAELEPEIEEFNHD